MHPKLIITTLGAVALLWPSTAESPIGAAGRAAPGPVTPLRIEYEIIHVPERLARPPRPLVSLPANRLAAARTPLQHRKPEGIVVRAGRMLVGDGRYRPEPFPRPSR